MTIGTKIRKLRDLHDLTQEYVAEKMGISQNALSKIERGETDPHYSQLKRIAEILNVDVSYLLTFGEKNIFNVENGQNAAIGNNHTVNHNDNRMIEHLQTEIIHLRQRETQLLDIINKRS
jgi:transcriptional regulator with XRE-family HTH domain